MKLIALIGGSGAGKSTSSKILEEKLRNSRSISLDQFMIESSRKREEQIFKALNIKKDPNVYAFNYYHESFTNMEKWIKVIEKDVIRSLKAKLKQFEKEKVDFVIIDWCYLPLCSFYKKIDITIYVKTADSVRLDRLTKRLKDKVLYPNWEASYESYKPGYLELRTKFNDLSKIANEADFKIINDGNKFNLEKQIEKLSTRIKFQEILYNRYSILTIANNQKIMSYNMLTT